MLSLLSSDGCIRFFVSVPSGESSTRNNKGCIKPHQILTCTMFISIPHSILISSHAIFFWRRGFWSLIAFLFWFLTDRVVCFPRWNTWCGKNTILIWAWWRSGDVVRRSLDFNRLGASGCEGYGVFSSLHGLLDPLGVNPPSLCDKLLPGRSKSSVIRRARRYEDLPHAVAAPHGAIPRAFLPQPPTHQQQQKQHPQHSQTPLRSQLLIPVYETSSPSPKGALISTLAPRHPWKTQWKS